MTDLEKRIADLNLTWVWTGKAFTTVHKGFGLVVYYRNNRNWLAVLSSGVVEVQLRCHRTKPPKIVGSWEGSHGFYTERMFETPVSDAFLVHVIESAFPEMLTLGNSSDGK